MFRAVTGHWPDAESHLDWFGWGILDNGEYSFFSCTLNTPDGWTTHRILDQLEKENLQDLVSQEKFDLLMKDDGELEKEIMSLYH